MIFDTDTFMIDIAYYCWYAISMPRWFSFAAFAITLPPLLMLLFSLSPAMPPFSLLSPCLFSRHCHAFSLISLFRHWPPDIFIIFAADADAIYLRFRDSWLPPLHCCWYAAHIRFRCWLLMLLMPLWFLMLISFSLLLSSPCHFVTLR